MRYCKSSVGVTCWISADCCGWNVLTAGKKWLFPLKEGLWSPWALENSWDGLLQPIKNGSLDGWYCLLLNFWGVVFLLPPLYIWKIFFVWKLLDSLDLGKDRRVTEVCEECYSDDDFTSLWLGLFAVLNITTAELFDVIAIANNSECLKWKNTAVSGGSRNRATLSTPGPA